MRIAVIGCGTAGPAAAVLLARQGHEVLLLERVAEPGPVGAGIMLQPSGMEVLHRLGLLDDVLEHTQRIDRLQGFTPRGRTVMDLAYADAGPGWFGMGLHRGVLLETLLGEVRATARQTHGRLELRCGVSVWKIREEEDGAWLTVDTGEIGPFDLIVVADGARSSLRNQVTRVKKAERYPWGALWAVVEQPADWPWPHTLRQIYQGTGAMLGLMPTGRAPRGEARLLSLFWSLPVDEHEALVSAGMDAFQQRIATLEPAAAGLLQELPPLESLPMAVYHDVVLHPRGRRTAILGDAAHAMSPQLGQGANFALVDAACLVDAVAAVVPGAGRPGPEQVDQLLKRYAKATVRRMKPFQQLTRWLTPVFQSSMPGVGPVRDVLFGPLSRFPLSRLAMIDGLTGRRALPFGLRRAKVPPPGLLLGEIARERTRKD